MLLYCAFMYTFAGGFVYVCLERGVNQDFYDKCTLSLSLILAPLVMPMIFGVIYAHENL